MQNSLALNTKETNFHAELVEALASCKGFKINVAFVSYSGLQLLLDTLKLCEERGIKGQVITSTYLNFSDPKSMRRLDAFSHIQLRIFEATKAQGFHPKGYIFEYHDHYKIYIGSSNLTQSALKSNIEWNVKTVTKQNAFIDAVNSEFDSIWERATPASDSFINQYETFLSSLKSQSLPNTVFSSNIGIQANSMQEEAVFKLSQLRKAGEEKALVIAATGSGKTYMSAFDFKSFDGKTMLFIVHRENILRDAMDSFSNVLGLDKKQFGFYTGSKKQLNANYIFATNIALSRNLSEFTPDQFDYIVIDEAHHITAQSYQNIVSFFKPQFLLGMTATPERGDANSIYKNFDNNIALEIRLRDALEEDLVVPFHYFGISDVKGIDYTELDLTNLVHLAAALKTHYRTQHIIEHINFYGYEGDTLKCLGFCATIDHAEFMCAEFMCAEFQDAGYTAIALTGDSSDEERALAIKNLSDEEHPLSVIFTVDIFNEGIDIPSINLVLMLRPTSSPVIFLQQLGRGLRKHEAKSFVTVLDFIGNHNRSFMIAIALYGQTSFDKDSLKVAVKRNFVSLPGCSHISLDPISKEQILAQLESENFNSLRYLKEEYYAFKSVFHKASDGETFPYLKHFLMIDGAPEPTKFIKYGGTYLHFLSRVEKDNPLFGQLLLDESFMGLYRFLCDHLPLNRLPVFVLMNMLIESESVSIRELAVKLSKMGCTYSANNLVFAFNYLAGKHFDKRQINTYKQLGYISVEQSSIWQKWYQSQLLEVNERALSGYDINHPDIGGLTFTRSADIGIVLADKNKARFIQDLVTYGMQRHEQEFGTRISDTKILLEHQQYNMLDVAFACEYEKKHSAFRGAGVFRSKQHIFLFVALHKDEDDIAYKDKFVSHTQIQWDSPNSSRPDRGLGLDIVMHQEKNFVLHMFVRKYKEIDGVVQPYIYVGEADYMSHEYADVKGQPITFQLNLQTPVPGEMYVEFVDG